MDDFDSMAWFYDWLPVPTHAKKVKAALGARGGTVVDLGGGTGKYTRRIVRSTDRVVVVDASPKMLKRARKRGLGTAVARAEAMPLADSSVDIVLCTEAFHHFGEGHDAVLAEVVRVLSPEGAFVVEEPDPSRGWGRWMAHGEGWKGMESVFRTPAEMSALLAPRFWDLKQSPSGRFTYLTVASRPRK